MKKYFLGFLFFLVLFCSGCGEIAETAYAPNSDGLVLEYYEDSYDYNGLRKYTSDNYKIEVYSDLTIKYGYVEEGLVEDKLSVSQYNKIIKIAFSDEFYDEFFSDIEIDEDSDEEPVLEENISGEEAEVGIDSRICLYSENSSSITVGGENPSNDLYEKLVKVLKKYAK